MRRCGPRYRRYAYLYRPFSRIKPEDEYRHILKVSNIILCTVVSHTYVPTGVLQLSIVLSLGIHVFLALYTNFFFAHLLYVYLQSTLCTLY